MAGRTNTPRERLLLALDRLAEQSSVLDIGINSLLKKSGVAKASLYSNFASKDELIVAWLEARQEKWFGFFDAHLKSVAAGGDPDSVLDAAFGFLEVWFERSDFIGCPFVATFLQVRDGRHPAAAAARRYAARLHGFFRGQLLAKHHRDPDRAASALLALFVGAVVARQMDVGAAPSVAAREAARAVYARPAPEAAPAGRASPASPRRRHESSSGKGGIRHGRK